MEEMGGPLLRYPIYVDVHRFMLAMDQDFLRLHWDKNWEVRIIRLI